MYSWLSFHLQPLDAPDAFLARTIRPFLVQHIWPTPQARAFFVRQQVGEQAEIRLRLHGETTWLETTLRPAFEAWFQQNSRIEALPYQPEPERFGGATALQLAEEHFHLSTRVVLDRLNRPYVYSDALFDGLRLHTIALFAAGFDRERAAWYCGQLSEQWLPVFFQPLDAASADGDWAGAVRESFAASFTAQEAELRGALQALWQALGEEKFDPEQPEWSRWLRGNQLILNQLGDNLQQALPSLLHLTNNRLGINNQDEVFLHYLLSRAL